MFLKSKGGEEKEEEDMGKVKREMKEKREEEKGRKREGKYKMCKEKKRDVMQARMGRDRDGNEGIDEEAG